jgi:crossover junction endodeoxyribonuclease RuvC
MTSPAASTTTFVTGSGLVLGIDPGLRVCGWGVVASGARPAYVACGVVKPSTKETLGNRLRALHNAIAALIAEHRPDEIAIEDPFVRALAPAAALAIGQARAMAVLAAAQAGIEVSLYAPAAVKASVAGYGASDKTQVQSMVRMLLNLDAPPQPFDAADALAVALCHLSNRRLAAIATAQSGNLAIGQANPSSSLGPRSR